MERDVELAPIRSLDDFILSSARFQLPKAWKQRVIKNLLYYQTNYFILAIIVFVVIGIINPYEMISCVTRMSIGIAMIAHPFRKSRNVVESTNSHPILAVIITAIYSWIVVYILLGAIKLFIFCVLLSILLSLLHASLRARNLRNKISNTLEEVGVNITPMGLLISCFQMNPHIIKNN